MVHPSASQIQDAGRLHRRDWRHVSGDRTPDESGGGQPGRLPTSAERQWYRVRISLPRNVRDPTRGTRREALAGTARRGRLRFRYDYVVRDSVCISDHRRSESLIVRDEDRRSDDRTQSRRSRLLRMGRRRAKTSVGLTASQKRPVAQVANSVRWPAEESSGTGEIPDNISIGMTRRELLSSAGLAPLAAQAAAPPVKL